MNSTESSESGNASPGPANPYGRFFFEIKFCWLSPSGSKKELDRISEDQSLALIKKALDVTGSVDVAKEFIQQELNRTIGKRFT